MSTVFSHAVVGLTLGATLQPSAAPARYWLLGAASACLPDLDVLALPLGIPYEHPFGHRGFTHSLVFAALWGAIAVATAFREPRWVGERGRLFLYLFCATASHGLLDAMTNGGRGVAFFAPVDATRYFLPVRPLMTPSIFPRDFFTWRGVALMRNKLLWIWLPAALAAAIASVARRSVTTARETP